MSRQLHNFYWVKNCIDRKCIYINIFKRIPRYISGSYIESFHYFMNVKSFYSNSKSFLPSQSVFKKIDALTNTGELCKSRKIYYLNSSKSFLTMSAPIMDTSSKSENASSPVEKASNIAEIRRIDYKQTYFVIEKIEMTFKLQDINSTVLSVLTMHRREGMDVNTDLRLDGDELKLLKLSINGIEVEKVCKKQSERVGYYFPDGTSDIVIDKSFLPSVPNEIFYLATEVTINPLENLQLSGLYMSKKLFCTQCEALGFRRITYFLDRPDIMATFRVRIEADRATCPVLLSNGNLIETGGVEGEEGRHYAIYDDPHPKPCYLFALIAGDLKYLQDSYVTKSGRHVNLQIFAEENDVKKLDWAMLSVKKAFKWDEETFNLEYDLDNFYIVCLKDYNMGAMENKGLVVFNASALLADNKTTDEGYKLITSIIGHEYFHNWTGNRVTLRDWFQLTLKEGLTVFRDRLFTESLYSHGPRRILDVIHLRSVQFAEDSGPMSHSIRPESCMTIENFYTSTVYSKGSEVIRMYQTLLGVEGFKKGMALYFQRHDGQAVTCDDFRAAMADANNVDLSQFEKWYSQAGTPIIEVLEAKYVAEEQQYILRFRQSIESNGKRIDGIALHIPIRIGLLGKMSKRDLIDSDMVLELKEIDETFRIKNIQEDCIPSILRDFSAPVKVVNKFESVEDLAFLMAHETDDFNRWEAGQKFATVVIMERLAIFQKIYDEYVKSIDDDNNYDMFDDINNDKIYKHPDFKQIPKLFLDSFRACLNDKTLHMTLKAYSLRLPNEKTLSQSIDNLDPVLLNKVIDSIVREIYIELKDDILEVYKSTELPKNVEETLEAHDVSRRELRNVLLGYVTSLRDEDACKIAYEQYCSENFTLKRSGFLELISMKCPQADKAINDLYEYTKDDAVALDKWFSLQTLSKSSDCFEKVQKLVKHPDFDIRNPNRYRSVYASFSSNLSKFHRKDGLGYKFLADSIIEVDKINPQIAASACKDLLCQKSLADEYKYQMRKYLNIVYSTSGLSTDTKEICIKGLK